MLKYLPKSIKFLKGERYTISVIYSHPKTDCFVVSQIISVARHARCFKQRSKPGQLDNRRTPYDAAIGKSG